MVTHGVGGELVGWTREVTPLKRRAVYGVLSRVNRQILIATVASFGLTCLSDPLILLRVCSLVKW